MTSLTIPYSAACERNKDPIWAIIAPYLESANTVLEIGSGTGQHAVYFAQRAPMVSWQTSDQRHYLDGVRAQIESQANATLPPPIELDVTQSRWLETDVEYDIIYTANTLHIMAWKEVEAFFSGLSQVTHKDSVLIVYGPFKVQGRHTSESNAAFDQSLQARGVGSGIRDIETICLAAQAAGFQLLQDHAMPANNRCLIWQAKVKQNT